ncbi:hypothetical protein [Nocardia arthritidis]|uniref:Ig-like domain repeat protein n=1 Tax=Nocardia arthritidis TaxID=228602 RepID=A0A6G9YFL1_9NOCA|nr:hypothetical protein [Nocardia arthritidis]QIS12075.1 hypothetical protein F5544_21060 [Nocardia arthritidis]
MLLPSKKTVAATLTTVGAVGAALVCTAPAAPAAVTSITITPGMSFGSSSQYGTGCSYTATANATPGDVIGFFDPTGSFDPSGWVTVSDSGSVTATWRPAVPGNHTLYAVRSTGEYVQTSVAVGTGINLGPACVVPS